MKPLRIFLAGIIQGSLPGTAIHSQNYRPRLAKLLRETIPHADVYDPTAEHANSVHYSDEQGRQVFLGHNYLCREMDVLIAFVPEATMGTAIEMWEGFQHGACVITVSPLKKNWVVRFLSHHCCETLEELEAAILSGEFLQWVEKHSQNR